MMTFSLRPRRVSRFPLSAASVSTRVVCWNEAAAIKLPVLRAALVMPCSTGEASAGRWVPVAADMGKRIGHIVPAEEDDPKHLPAATHAHIRVGNARFRGPVIVPAARYEIELDLDPPGWLDRSLAGGAITRVPQAHDDPEIDPMTRLIRSLVLKGSSGSYEVNDVPMADMQFQSFAFCTLIVLTAPV